MPDEHRTYRSRGSLHTDLLIFCALLGAGAVALGAFSWSRPTRAASTVTYDQTGALSYKGAAAAASAYGTKGVLTREPVYLSAVKDLTITYAYRITAQARITAGGTEHLSMSVSNDSGLVRTVPLTPVHHFAGNGFSTTSTLSLATVSAVADSFAAPGRDAGPVTVSIIPDVAVHGQIGGTPLRATFDQATKFTFASTTLSPDGTSGSSTAVTSPTAAADVGRPIPAAATGAVTVPDSRSATLTLGVSVLDGRIASVAVFVASVLALLLVGLPLRKKMRSPDERVRIALRFGSALVEVDSLPEPSETIPVDLSSFEGLMQVARQLECPVLHLQSSSFDSYAVVDNLTVYCYRVGGAGRVVGSPTHTSPRSRARHVESNGNGTEAPATTL